MRPFTPQNYVLSSLNEQDKIFAQNECIEILKSSFDSPLKNYKKELTLEPIQVSSKSQVYRASLETGSIIVKRHSKAKNYFSELLAYELLSGRSPIPKLLNSLDSSQIILLEYIPLPFYIDSIEKLCKAAASLGKIHQCLGLRPEVLTHLFPHATLGRLLEERAYIWQVEDSQAIQELLEFSVSLLGNDYVPLAIGDLKSSHLLESQQKCLFTDLESFVIGLFEQIDLLSLVNLAPGYQLDLRSWTLVIDAYQNSRKDFNYPLSTTDLLMTMKLTAKGLGLPYVLSV
jgi:hypothetical protein